MSLTIRALTLDDDLAAFGRIVVQSYEALPGQPDDPIYFAELVDVAHRIETDVVLGAFEDETPLGCVTYVNDPSSPHAELLRDDEASFRMLAVDVLAQGRGIGDALSKACIDRARSNRRGAAFIYSGDWMTGAHRLYARLGFERVPERDRPLPNIGGLLLLAFRLALGDPASA